MDCDIDKEKIEKANRREKADLLIALHERAISDIENAIKCENADQAGLLALHASTIAFELCKASNPETDIGESLTKIYGYVSLMLLEPPNHDRLTEASKLMRELADAFKTLTDRLIERGEL